MALICLGLVTRDDAHVLFIPDRTGAWQQQWSGGCAEVERLGMVKEICPLSLGGWVALGDSSVSLSTAALFGSSTALLYNEVLDFWTFLSHCHMSFNCLCVLGAW